MNQLKITKCYKIINILNYSHARYSIMNLKLFPRFKYSFSIDIINILILMFIIYLSFIFIFKPKMISLEFN